MNLEEYFIYLPVLSTSPKWGCHLLGVGFTEIKPGQKYPPKRHPDDHHFDWNTGRRLQAFQILLITEGGGVFESAKTTKRQRVRAGSLILLFPGIWHRYRPDHKTGWKEHWLEGSGPAFEQAFQCNQLNPAQPIIPARPEMAETFHEIHRWIKRDPLAYQPLLSALLLQVIALIICPNVNSSKTTDDRRIRLAMMEVAERNEEKLHLRQMARKYRLSYSVFRDLFTRQAGTSPKQYQLQARLRRARELLLNSQLSIKEIAALLGFQSPAHFSSYFRKRHACSPRQWKRVNGDYPNHCA